jgi:hypothetical protein
MKYYVIEPEVAGGFGEHTVIDRSTGKMVVQKLHYKFDGWLGGELLESAPCYIVTERLASEIERAQFTGVRFEEVEVSASDQFTELYPNRHLPKFLWLKVDGKPGHEDFGLAPGLQLVVSERAVELLHLTGIPNAAYLTPFESG